MQLFNLLIITPESTLYQGEVLSAIFPGKDGSFEILANHAAFISMVRQGVVQITDKNKKKQTIAIPEGIFEFFQNNGVLLSTHHIVSAAKKEKP